MNQTVPKGNYGGQLLAGEERRRSQRVMLRIPVTLRIMVAGKVVTVRASTVSVNDHGAMVICSRSFSSEAMLELENDRTSQKMNCRVTRAPVENPDGYLIPMEFATPAPNFWGISFPPKDWKPGDE
jgi:hypothetical protein